MPRWPTPRPSAGRPNATFGLARAGSPARTTIEYLRPALAGDKIVVQTHVTDMKNVTSRRVYQHHSPGDGELLAKAETHWAFISYATGKPARIPAEVAESYVAASTRAGDAA